MPGLAFLSPISESVPPLAFSHALAAISKSGEQGLRIEQIGITERTLVHTARSILAEGFLNTNCEWAFWWDCDMIIPPNTIPRLMEVAKEKDAKFVTGVYYQRLGQHMPVLWKKDPVPMDGTKPVMGPATDCDNAAYRHFYCGPGPDCKTPFKADVCGFGCVLTHREMFEKIAKPHFKMISGQCSEDFYFCVEAKKAGYQLWADPTLKLGHIGRPGVVYQEHCKLSEAERISVKP